MFDNNTPLSRRSVLRATGGALVAGASGGVAAASEDDSVRVNVGYSEPSGQKAARDRADRVIYEFAFDELTIRTSRKSAD